MMECIEAFCQEKKIYTASFSGIGAVQDIGISVYNLKEKKREIREYNEPFELVSLNGTVALLEGEVSLHAHGTFTDREHQTKSGHIHEATVHAACEIVITKGEGVLQRAYDEQTGLNLFSL